MTEVQIYFINVAAPIFAGGSETPLFDISVPGFPNFNVGDKISLNVYNDAPVKFPNIESKEQDYIIRRIKHSFDKKYNPSSIVETSEKANVYVYVEETWR